MTGFPALLAGALILSALWRVGVVARVLAGRASLPRAAAAPDPADTPLVSVLIPARDEERGVEACLDSLSAQTYPRLEIIVIDDDSRDRTPEIVAAAAARDRRIRTRAVAGPPPGWTGKSFALVAGLDLARGAWLCFTDADTVHAPDAVRRAVGFAQASGTALLSLTSRQLTGSFWEKVVQPVVFGLLDRWFPLDRVNDPASPLAAANGIFILVRRDAYEAVGGHRAVAGEILEDVALARNVKRSGRRIAFVDGADLVAARMYTGLRAIRLGWTKNLYALRGRRPGSALLSAAELLLTAVWPVAACGTLAALGHRPGALVAALAAALVIGAEAPFRARRGDDPRWSVTLPLGALLVAAFLLESAVRDWLSLGVRWKDRLYTT
jgi:chlorobactene glucosyltransferase